MHERVAAVDDRRRLREEHVRELLLEGGRATSGRLDERIAIAIRDARRRRGQEGREGAEDEVDVVAIPYYAWANREIGAMRVWLPRA